MRKINNARIVHRMNGIGLSIVYREYAGKGMSIGQTRGGYYKEGESEWRAISQENMVENGKNRRRGPYPKREKRVFRRKKNLISTNNSKRVGVRCAG